MKFNTPLKSEYTGRYISICGALAGRHPGTTFPVVSAVAKLIDENHKYSTTSL